MSLFNHASVTIVGGLTRDAELKFTPNGYPILEFSVGSSKSVKQADGSYQDRARYYDCKVLGERGQNLAERGVLSKGTPVVVIGDLDQETWDDKQSGQKRSRYVVIVDKVIDFARPPKANAQG